MSIIINGDTGVSGVDGSAATPSYQGTDTNAGIFYPAADTVAFGTAGSERMRIDSSGNVGIGTSSPSSKLNVAVSSAFAIFPSNTTAGGLILQNTDSTTNNFSSITNRNSLNISTAAIGFINTDQTNSYSDISFATRGAGGISEKMRITSTGGVNVGTYSADPGAGNMNVTGTVAMGSSFLRNRIINGDMQVWQRGTTFTGTVATPTPVQYGADRWFSSNNYNGGGAVIVMSQVSTGLQAVWSGTTAANGRINIGQTIESLNCSDLWGKTVTIQAQVRAVGSMSICNIGVGFNTTNVAYTPGGGTFIGSSANVAINSSTFTTITYTVTLPSAPSSTASLGILINPSRTSGTETTGDGIIINNVQLEIGTLATPFERRLYGQELALCQRYYYRITPGTTGSVLAFGSNSSTTSSRGAVMFPVEMRIAPAALEQSGTANQYQVQQFGIGTTTCSSVPVLNSSNTRFSSIAASVASGLTQFNPAAIGTDATNGATAYLGWSAEL